MTGKAPEAEILNISKLSFDSHGLVRLPTHSQVGTLTQTVVEGRGCLMPVTVGYTACSVTRGLVKFTGKLYRGGIH